MKLAIMASAAAIAVYAGATANSTPTPPPEVVIHATLAPMTFPVSRSELREKMRELWTDHVVWTRSFIVAAVDGGADAPSYATRLMKNQEEIGSAVGEFYGTAAGEKLTGLLKQHIGQASDLVKALKGGNKETIDAADKAWKANAETIADFLAGANPNWKRADLREMMKWHLSSTADEVAARMNKDWAADVKAFDHVYDHILKMSDALADGIAKQFPTKVTE